MDVIETIYNFSFIGLILFLMIELMATSFFVPSWFHIGIKVRTILDTNINFEHFEIGKEYKTKHVKLKRVSENSCLYLYRPSFFQMKTFFPIRYEILKNESGTQLIIWRMPLGSILIGLLWVIVWINPLLLAAFHLSINQVLPIDFAAALLGSSFGVFWAWLIYTLSARTEIKHAGLAFSEVLSLSLHQQPPFVNG